MESDEDSKIFATEKTGANEFRAGDDLSVSVGHYLFSNGVDDTQADVFKLKDFFLVRYDEFDWCPSLPRKSPDPVQYRFKVPEFQVFESARTTEDLESCKKVWF